MKNVQTDQDDLIYKGNGKDVGDLHCRREIVVDEENRPVQTAIYSTWELDTDDLATVQSTHRIALGVFVEPIPPVSLSVVDEQGALRTALTMGPPVARDHLKRAIHRLVEVLRDEHGVDAADPDDVMAGLEQCLEETVHEA